MQPVVVERQAPLSRRKANVIYISLVLFLSSLVTIGVVDIEFVGFPLNLFTNNKGEINGVMVAIISKLILIV